MVKLGILLAALAISAHAQAASPDTCVCTLEHKPVCGTDGHTYPNLCQLQCATKNNPQLKTKHDGPCKTESNAGTKRSGPRCPCSAVYAPVCGTDGKTYCNQRKLECEMTKNLELRKKHDGGCKTDETAKAPKFKRSANPTCSCPKIKQPVCGSNGVTYDNDCLLQCAAKTKPGLKKVHEGACQENKNVTPKVVKPSPKSRLCPCPEILQPVCGSNGVTYDNDCLLQCAAKTKPGLKKVHEGACQENKNVTPKVVKPSPKSRLCPCPEILQPVCGSNGVTYDNDCLLQCAAKTKPGLKKVHEGACQKKVVTRSLQKPTCACHKDMRPVCGSDGITYNNVCLLKCAAKTKPGLKKVREGACKKV